MSRDKAAEIISKIRLEDQPGFLTRVALQRVTGIFSDVFREENLTPSQHMALVAADELGEATQRRISRYKSMEPSNLHGILKKLSERKLITIRADPSNKRSSVIKLTAKGTRLLRRLEPLEREVVRRYLSPLNTAEQKRFTKLLLRVAFDNRSPMQQFKKNI